MIELPTDEPPVLAAITELIAELVRKARNLRACRDDCLVRAALYVAAAEMIDPHTVRRLAMVGGHAGVVEDGVARRLP